MTGLPNIVVGSVPAGSTDPFSEVPDYLDKQAMLKGLVSWWQVQSSYTHDHLRVALPIAVGSQSDVQDTFQVVALGQPTSTRVVRIRGERVGQWPTIPTEKDRTDTNGISQKILKAKIVLSTPDRESDGTQKFVVDAEFRLALLRKPTKKEPLLVGMNLWERIRSHYTSGLFNDSQVL